MFEFPVLLGDIGGTNARFAVLPAADALALALPPGLTASHPGPIEAARAALAGQDCPGPRSALLAVATRVFGPVVRLTNAAWTIDAGEIGTALGLSRVALVNDFVPVAVSTTVLREDRGELIRIGPPLPIAPGPRLALGPGTGFGAAALVPVGERLAILASEAAHVEFGPSDAGEAAWWPGIEPVEGRVTAETCLSGPGLIRLYRALGRSLAAPLSCATPSEVVTAAEAGSDALARESLRLFARLLGRFAGDLALTFAAGGGVFIAGGIAPRIVDLLGGEEFRAAFEHKAPFAALMRRTPTFVMIHPEPAFAGLSLIAANARRFSFESQGWARPEAG